MISNNTSKFIDERVHNIHDVDELTEVYTKWADSYDEDVVQKASYNGYVIISKLLDVFSFQNKERTILDIGAGTGLVAQKLRELGYINIDALEPNQDMIQKAKEKKLYNNYISEIVHHNEPLKLIKENTYDRITAAGCFSIGHMDYRHIKQLVRLLKPGGFLIFGFRYSHLQSHQQEVIPEIKRLENENIVEVKLLTEIPDYYPGVPGFMTVLTKL